MRLSDLKTGEKAVIVKVLGYGGFRKRIVEMGFIKGKIVESVASAPLNDPIEYRIMGYEISLRRSEASQIVIISIEEAQQIAKENEEKSFHGIISEEDIRRVALKRRKSINVALVGNPNSGKTSLFNIVSGKRERVGNYSGVTVDAKEGFFDFEGYHIKIVDLPGTYSLSAYSPEEKYVRNHIVTEKPDIIVNVIDASNLERNLYLTTQLIDMNLRMVIALNMYDELEEKGDTFDYDTLGKLIGVPIIPTVSPKKIGIKELFEVVIKLYESGDIVDEQGNLIPSVKDDSLLDEYLHEVDVDIHHKHDDISSSSDLEDENSVHATIRHIHINHGQAIEKAIAKLKAEIAKNPNAGDEYTPRYLAIKLLEQDKDIERFVSQYFNFQQIINLRDELDAKLSSELKESAENAIMDAKYGFIDGALKETYKPSKTPKGETKTSKIDRIVTHKYWGYPIFLAILFAMFQTTFYLGSYPMEWIEMFVGWVGEKISGAMQEGMLRDLLVDGIVGGVGGVLVFLPNILILYFFITIMESTGYMARAAFMMDKIMHKMGLHGRSFIPLIMGFGCNVPAIMATRTIENHNSRMITMLINPLMSCSARLPIYILLAGTFFPSSAGLVIFCMYVSGIILAVLVARLLKRFLFKKDETPFVMELPPYRMPTTKSLLRDTWEKGQQYLRKIATVILIGSVIIWTLSYFPRHEQAKQGAELTLEMKKEQQENSYLGKIGNFIEPVMKPLGFNWKISIALLSGVAAKEVVVSTLGVLYNVDMELDTGNDEDIRRLGSRLNAELNPDGTPAFTPAIALSLMLFVLIYFPCIATIITIKNESGSWKWALFTALYTVVLAWIVSFAAYNLFSLLL